MLVKKHVCMVCDNTNTDPVKLKLLLARFVTPSKYGEPTSRQQDHPQQTGPTLPPRPQQQLHAQGPGWDLLSSRTSGFLRS